jgi:serine/threonine protein kinase
MAFDQTEHQSHDEISKAEQLSLKKTSPPAEIAGYSLQNFLGSGAYGEVWTGIDQNTGRRVAVKFYTRRSSVDFAMLAREVEKLAQLAADRYVVQLLDVGWDADPPYYVMDHIENGSLEVELQARGTMPVSEAVEMFQEVGIGLMHLHSRGILHCDLKPGNVLLDQDNKPRLADFGQSRLSHEQTAALGTLFYMAPEQASLDAIPDARWDVYALGALLYTMLTGAPPYRTPNVIEQVESATEMDERLKRYRKAIADAPAPNKHRKVSGVDRQLADIIDRCIASKPANRFDSVHSALLALRQREEARTRRPLMILGLVGPLVLLTVMGLFGRSVYRSAIDQAELGLLQKAQESNHWSAQFAARSAGEQIDDYFRAVESLAEQDRFKQLLREVLTDEDLTPLRNQLTDPNQNEASSLDLTRTQLIDNEKRIQLDELLKVQMTRANVPAAASWFVCDESGLQIASAFDTESASVTVGRNYAFRSYFQIENRDLKDPTTDRYDVPMNIADRQHITQSHMSQFFISQATNVYKVAFSTPLYVDDKFAGIVACTVNMGDFIEFQNSDIHYAMLVEGRAGKNRGVILEHPLFNQFRSRNEPLPVGLSNHKVDLDEVDNGYVAFVDPLSAEPLGKSYDKDWIAAKSEVKRRNQSNREIVERKPTGLIVLTMEDKNAVLAPVNQLSTTLLQIGFAALAVITVLAICFWYWVMRSLRESRDRVGLAFRSAERSLASGGSLPATVQVKDARTS